MAKPPANVHAQFKPGQSGNPRGRPKGVAALAREIQQRVGLDGKELVDFAWTLWKDTAQPMAIRLEAFRWLSDRGFGRPLQSIELSAEVAGVALVGAVDLSQMAADKVDAIVEALATALAEPGVDDPWATDPPALEQGKGDAGAVT